MSTEQQQQQQQAPSIDNEGLQAEYDVVLGGTGLVQAILASALSRAGLSVLHCDGADVYGELDGAWSLADLMEREKELDRPSQQEPQQKEEVEEGQQQLLTPKSAIVNNNNSTGNAATTIDVDTRASIITSTDPSTCTDSHLTTHSESSVIPLSPQGGTTSLRFHSFDRKTRFGIQVGSAVLTPFGQGIVVQVPTSKTTTTSQQVSFEASPSSTTTTSSATDNVVIVAWEGWNLDKNQNGHQPLTYFGLGQPTPSLDWTDPFVLEDYLYQIHGIRSMASIQASNLLHKTRAFVLDISPVAIYAAGQAVDALLTTNVADYLEFKTVEALLWIDGNSSSDKETNHQSLLLTKVPCSKNDVFTTTLLSPMDKRRLMKFLQLAMDFAIQMAVTEQPSDATTTTTDGTDGPAMPVLPSNDQVKSLNERQLNQGRSLPRPQNKAVASDELSILQDWMQQSSSSSSSSSSVTLEDYLTQHQKLSPRLRSIIRHALALEMSDQPASLKSSMARLRCHLQALGRYGTTPFLLPMYGSGELSQAFTRSAAVFGATYLLRRALLGIQYHNLSDATTTRPVVQGVILAAESEDGKPNPSSRQKFIRAKHVVVPTNALIPATTTTDNRSQGQTQRVLRRISVLNGTLVDGDQRHVFIMPPHTVAGHPHAIHGISMDSSLQVAPPGCTILHLTTVLTSTTENDIQQQFQTLDTAAQILLRENHRIAEIYAATYSFTVGDTMDTASFPEGLHLCNPCGHATAADIAFEQAETIFYRICPGKQFLALSEELDAASKVRDMQRGQDDEERFLLNSAMTMITNQSTE